MRERGQRAGCLRVNHERERKIVVHTVAVVVAGHGKCVSRLHIGGTDNIKKEINFFGRIKLNGTPVNRT